MVAKLVLQTERLVSSSGYVGFTLQFAPTVIIAEPNQITVFIGHLAWDGDFVAMEVVGLLVAFAFGIGVVVYLRQRFVTVGIGVEIGIPAVPNKSGFFFEAVWIFFVFQMAFAYPSA